MTRFKIPTISTDLTKRMEGHTFRVIKGIFLFLSILLIVWIGKLIVFDSNTISVNAYNPRLAKLEEGYIRGSILDAGGNVLAYTQVNEAGEKTRVYPYGKVFAHVTGYSAKTKTGLELAMNTELLSASSWLDTLRSSVRDTPVQGCDVVTTLQAELQEKAYALLGDHSGAVVVSEPSTGKILALVSTPAYDPNTVFSQWEEISQDESAPLFPRATQGKYAPGSTFKIITSLALYRTDSSWQDYRYTCEGETVLGNTTLPCFDHKVHGEESIADAFANSCNTFYANLGLHIGAKSLRSCADSLLFNSDIEFILPIARSSFPLSEDDTVEMVGETSIGQGKTMVSPFHMNLITNAIANEGMLYEPYMVDRVVTKEGNQISKNLPKLYGALLEPQEAAYLEEMMAGVIARGTATSLQNSYCQVYGKTGTAQVGEGEEAHSWFTGYTKTNGSVDIAVTVVVEHGAESKRAVPLVKELLEYYYSR